MSLLQERQCGWCRSELEATASPTALFCGRRCRQTAFRLRRRGQLYAAVDRPMSFGYADPPYLGLSSKYYRDEPTFAGEVDHVKLVSLLEERHPDGWALSGSARSLPLLLSLVPAGARVCAWVKPHGAAPATLGLHNVWEPLIVVRGRQVQPGVPDALVALPARGGGTLPGRKPIAFCSWLYAALGMRSGDELVDWFPGTGVVGRGWRHLSRVDERRQVSPSAELATPAKVGEPANSRGPGGA